MNESITTESREVEEQVVFDLLVNMIGRKYEEASKGGIKAYEKIADFSAFLSKKYGKEEALKRRLFHVLVRTGKANAPYPYFDFEGDDSIEKFILSL